jgi:hypothetical protein
LKTKTITIVLLGLILTACGVDVSLSTDSGNVTSAAAEIADFDLPAGYYADFSSTVMDYEVAAYSRGDGPSHIYLIQSDGESDGEKLAQVLDQLVIGSGDPETRMKVIETRSVIVRGQETTLVISDAVNSEGLSYRQAAVGFPGNGGPALLVFSESIENWDQASVDTFVSSIQ